LIASICEPGGGGELGVAPCDGMEGVPGDALIGSGIAPPPIGAPGVDGGALIGARPAAPGCDAGTKMRTIVLPDAPEPLVSPGFAAGIIMPDCEPPLHPPASTAASAAAAVEANRRRAKAVIV
jgi:hypothetical protein